MIKKETIIKILIKTGNMEFFKEKVFIKPIKNELKNDSVVINVGFIPKGVTIIIP